MQRTTKSRLANLTFPINYVTPLQPDNLNSSIERLHKCVNSTLQHTQIHALRRCHELTNHYIMGRVENQTYDYSPKLGHCLTLILREVSETVSSKATIQVQLFDSYATLTDCIKPGNLIILTGARVDISMLCRPKQLVPHSQLQVTAKPQFQRNFKLFFMPDYTDISLPKEEIKFKVTSVSASKSMKPSEEPIHVNVRGIITASTPFETVNEKEWVCFILLADLTVKLDDLNECSSINSSLLIKFVSSTCLNTFERGLILRILCLQIIEQNDVVLGLMRTDSQSALFQVLSNDSISVHPLHSETRIQPIEWQKVKEIYCWWASFGNQDINSDVLTSYLLSKGLVSKKHNILAELSTNDKDAECNMEQMLDQYPNPKKRKYSESSSGTEITVDNVMRRDTSKSPLKIINNLQSTGDLSLNPVTNNEMKPTETNANVNLKPDVVQEVGSMGKLIKLDDLDRDMCFSINCQVVGCYYPESFDKVILKVWDGSKCQIIHNRNSSDAALTTKFEDPNLADIEDLCVDVALSGLYKQHADVIELFDIVNMCDVHAIDGRLFIPEWYCERRGITIYGGNAFKRNLLYNLDVLRKKLKKKDPNSATSPNPQPVASTASIPGPNVLSGFNAFSLLDKIKNGFVTAKETAADVSNNLTRHNNVDAVKESLNQKNTEAVMETVEHNNGLFKPPALKVLNMHLLPSLSVIGQEDMYFDIFSQVVGCYHNADPTKIILKIWDGTICHNAKFITPYDSWTVIFEDPHLVDIDEYCIYVNVYDEYMKMTQSLQLYDIVKLCNLRTRNGVFAMNGGKTKQRRILTCSPYSAVAKSLSTKLKELREKNAQATAAFCLVPVQMNAIDDLDNRQGSQPCTNDLAAMDSALPLPVDKDVHSSPTKLPAETSVKEVLLEPNQNGQVSDMAASARTIDPFPTVLVSQPCSNVLAVVDSALPLPVDKDVHSSSTKLPTETSVKEVLLEPNQNGQVSDMTASAQTIDPFPTVLVSQPCSNVLAAVDSALQLPVDKDEHSSPTKLPAKTSVKEVLLEPNQNGQVSDMTASTRTIKHFPMVICAEPTKNCKAHQSSVAKIKRTSTSAIDNFPYVICAEPTKECKAPPSSVAKIKRKSKPALFCFIGAVIDIQPRAYEISELVKWFCKSCQYMVSGKNLKGFKVVEQFRYHCPCNEKQIGTSLPSATYTVKILEPIYVLRMTLHDPCDQILEVTLCGPQAETFFHSYSPIDFLKHEDIREQFAALFRSLCKTPGSLTKSSYALHCQIFSSINKNANFIYNIVNTKLLPFHEIT